MITNIILLSSLLLTGSELEQDIKTLKKWERCNMSNAVSATTFGETINSASKALSSKIILDVAISSTSRNEGTYIIPDNSFGDFFMCLNSCYPKLLKLNSLIDISKNNLILSTNVPLKSFRIPIPECASLDDCDINQLIDEVRLHYTYIYEPFYDNVAWFKYDKNSAKITVIARGLTFLRVCDKLLSTIRRIEKSGYWGRTELSVVKNVNYIHIMAQNVS